MSADRRSSEWGVRDALVGGVDDQLIGSGVQDLLTGGVDEHLVVGDVRELLVGGVREQVVGGLGRRRGRAR